MKRTVSLFTAILLALLLLLPGCAAKETAAVLAPEEILTTSYDSMQAVKSFHFVLDHVGGGTPITAGVSITMTKAEGDIMRPDKFQTTIAGTVMGSAIEVGLVTIGSDTMMKNPMNGKWEPMSDMFAILTVFDPGTGVAAIINGLSDPEDAGDEKIGDVLCYHLTGTIASEDLKPLTGATVEGGVIPAEVWIDKDTMLVQQVRLTGKITNTEKDGIERTLTFTNYGADIEIALPPAD